MKYYQTVIDEPFKYLGDILTHKRSPLYMPVIEGLVENASTGQMIHQVEKFFVDTGASMNILGPKFMNYFDDSHIIDRQPITYGNTKVTLPVYRVNLLIKGNKFESIIAAIDPKLQFHSLLGNEFFLKHIEKILFDYNKKTMKLINIKHKESIS